MSVVKRKPFIILAVIILAVIILGLTVFCLFKYFQPKEMPRNINQVLMKDDENGWAITKDGSLLYTNNKWKSYKQVAKFSWIDSSIPSISYADNSLFVVGFLKDKSIGIYKSLDEGNTWTESSIDYSDDDSGANQLFCSFTDDQNGYVLYCGGPAAGLMSKFLYRTNDGGKSFQKVEDLSYIKGYPTGIAFNKNNVGFIASTYHGDDNSYLYCSEDQGMAWNTFAIQPPEDLSYGYVNGYQPYFIGEDGFMILEYVGEQPTYIMYHSTDNGSTWSPTGNVNINSDSDTDSVNIISSYSLSDSNTVYIVDKNGKMIKRVSSGDVWK